MELNNSITITLLEIKPSLKELEKNNNEISIIFQGINVFYSLRKLISNNTEILLNNCKKSLIMSLVKSDNIFASALFNLNHGENWVTFNYESKTKLNIKKSINNINCIKLKIFCRNNASNNNDSQSQLNNKSINSNNSKTKRYHTNKNIINIKNVSNNDNKNHLKYNSILTENNKNLYHPPINSKTLNKKNTGKIKSSDLFKKTRNQANKSKLTNINNNDLSLLTVSYRRTNTSSNCIIVNNKKSLINSHSYRGSKNNIHKLKTQKSTQNFDNLKKSKYLEVNSCLKRNVNIGYNKNLKTSNNINNTTQILYLSNNSPPNSFRNKITNLKGNLEFENNLYFGYNKNTHNNNLNDNKAKLIIKNRLCKSKIQGNITNSYSTTTTKKNEFEGSLNSFQDELDKKNNKKKNFFTSNRQKLRKDSFHNKDKSSENNNNKINVDKTVDNNIFSNNLENDLEEENYLKYLKEEGEQDFEFDEYTRLKNDLNLLYNKEYIANIKNDLLKLEIELFVEKMTELISVYHRIIEERINENRIAKFNYKQITQKYTIFYKLNNKLQLIKDKYQTKKYNLNDNKRNIKIQTNNNIILNKEECSIFSKLINNNININKRLKEILAIILKNQKNKNPMEHDGFKLWLQEKEKEKQSKNKNIRNKIIIRTKPIPKKQHTTILSNISEIELNNDNSVIINKVKTGGVYIKKTPKSPINNKIKNSQININVD